jgi:hypothetical protein
MKCSRHASCERAAYDLAPIDLFNQGYSTVTAQRAEGSFNAPCSPLIFAPRFSGVALSKCVEKGAFARSPFNLSICGSVLSAVVWLTISAES